MKIEHIENSLEGELLKFGKDGTALVLKEEGVKTFFLKEEGENSNIIAKMRLKVLFPGAKSLTKEHKAGKYNNPMTPSNGRGFTTHRYKNIVYAKDVAYRDFSSQFAEHPETESNAIKTVLFDRFVWDNIKNNPDTPSLLPHTAQLRLF